jgi:hypothetical protein
MSELAIFKGGIPSYLKNIELDADTRAVAGGAGNKRISIKGSVFRMIVDGDEIAVNEDRSMNVVIVRMAHKPSRTFYMGQYREGEKVAPACWSSDGDKPDSGVEKPQSSSCASCPKNIKGSGEGDSRACRFRQRLAVVLENDLNGDIYQLTLPATSYFGKGEQNKWPFKQYVQFLAGHNVPVGAVVTEMKFDTKSPVPKLTFRPVIALEEADYDTIRSRGESPSAVNAIRMTVSQTDKTATKAIAAPKAKAVEVEAEDVEEAAPVRKVTKKPEPVEEEEDKSGKLKSVLSKWASDDEDE